MDHPRMCGEKLVNLCNIVFLKGSPPHVRGKVGSREGRYLAERITPACAGKRTSGATASGYTSDHPRMCGEKLLCKLGFYAKFWITPACAGKSASVDIHVILDRGSPPHVRGKVSVCGRARPYWRDHPRMCGEKFLNILLNFHPGGSPPHVRGKEQ